MKGYRTPKLRAVFTAALCISLLAISAFAQVQSGNIYGKVQGKDGSVLPGVSVTLSGVAVVDLYVARGRLRAERLDALVGYWRSALAGAPRDLPRPSRSWSGPAAPRSKTGAELPAAPPPASLWNCRWRSSAAWSRS